MTGHLPSYHSFFLLPQSHIYPSLSANSCSEAQRVMWNKLEVRIGLVSFATDHGVTEKACLPPVSQALYDQLPCQELLEAIITLTKNATRDVGNKAQLIDLQEDARRLRQGAS